ncbi:MAG: hypothetical protein BWY31_01484 [Lentisphaerae bacterium ADurb.Bin242]|nr:MAG: hypothetical protein BWY31_01484 [Lentisphaerae bacterium ADurb.Bin242]
MENTTYNLITLHGEIDQKMHSFKIQNLNKKNISHINSILIDFWNKTPYEGVRKFITDTFVIPFKIKEFQELLIHEYNKTNDAEFRWYIGQAIAEITPHTPSNIHIIHELICSRQDLGCVALIFWLQKTSNQESPNVLKCVLDPHNNAVTNPALKVLGKIGCSQTIDAIKQLLLQKPTPEIKKQACKVLKSLEQKNRASHGD